LNKVKSRASELLTLIPEFYANKTQADVFSKKASTLNGQIKEIMTSEDITSFTAGDLKASCSTSLRESFNEEKLLEKLKKLKIRGIIKKREYVDMEALESAIYHGRLDAATLSDCREVSYVTTLRVTRVKKNAKEE